MHSFDTYEGRFARLSLILGAFLVGIGLALFPFNWMWGLPFLLGSSAFLLPGLFMYFAARNTAGRINRLRAGGGLFRWTLDWEEWRAFSIREFKRIDEKARNIGPALFVTAVSGCFVLWRRELANLFDAIALLALICSVLSLIAAPITRAIARRDFQRAIGRKEDVIIDETGVLYNGRYHRWASWGLRVDNAQVIEGEPACLEVKTSQPARHGRYHFEFRVPVPRTKVAQAEDIVRCLLGKY